LGLEQAMLAPLMKAGAYASNDKLIQKELGVVEKRLEDGDLVVDLEALKNFSL